MVPSGSSREEGRPVNPLEQVVEDFSQEVEDSAEVVLHALEADVAPPVPADRAKRTVSRAWIARPKAAAPEVGLSGQPDLARMSTNSARQVRPAAEDQQSAKRSRISSHVDQNDEAPMSLMDKRLDSNHKKAKKDTKKRRGHRSKRSKSRCRSSSDRSVSRSPRCDEKKRRRRSPSSSDSSEISSVFRGVSDDPSGKTWEALKSRSRRYPGKLATKLMQQMADQVGRDGVSQE